MHFSKYHALGNVYIVIDRAECNFELHAQQIKMLCDAHYGIGGDGVLVGVLNDLASIHVQIFNADGSRAKRSGNGLRIFARYLWDQEIVKQDRVSFRCDNQGIVANKKGDKIEISLGNLSFLANKLIKNSKFLYYLDQPFVIDDQVFYGYCCSIGNPHTVFFFNEISSELIQKFGARLENDPRFIDRSNIQFVKVLNRYTLQIEIWERGVGYTLSSGTSSCAAAGMAHYLDYVDECVSVMMQGGLLEVNIEKDYTMHIEGSVFKIEEGDCSLEMLELLRSKVLNEES